MFPRIRLSWLACALCLCVLCLPSLAASQVDRVQVEAEGIGATKMEALQAAWMEAVRQGVGLFMAAKTEVLDDDLTEKIVTHSRGQVNSYEVISETKTDAGWVIIIKANIDKDILEETAKSTQSQTVSFDAKNTAASNISRETKSKSQKESLESIIDMFDFTDCIKYSFSVEKFQITKDNNTTDKFFAIHTIQFNMESYLIKIKQLMSALDKICTKSEDIILDVENSKKFINSITEDIAFDPENVYSIASVSKTRKAPFHMGSDPNSISIIYSTGRAKKYFFDTDIRNIINAIRKKHPSSILFSVESDNSFDSMIAESKVDIHSMCIFPEHTIEPVIHFSDRYDDRYAGKMIFLQVLQLSNEQLLSIDNLQGTYTLLKRRG